MWFVLGLGSLPFQVSLPVSHMWMWDHPFHWQPLPHYCHLATTILCPLDLASPALSLLPVWMNVSSLSPWLLDFHTIWFSGSSGYFSFEVVVIVFMVVQRGEVCLPKPPSWPEVLPWWCIKQLNKLPQILFCLNQPEEVLLFTTKTLDQYCTMKNKMLPRH